MFAHMGKKNEKEVNSSSYSQTEVLNTSVLVLQKSSVASESEAISQWNSWIRIQQLYLYLQKASDTSNLKNKKQ